MTTAQPGWRFLTLPGRGGAAPGHWQSRWERACAMRRVEQSDWRWPRRGDWMARLDEALLEDDGATPAVLVAHGLGCHLVASWAAHSRLTARVAAALLVAPPDTEAPGAPLHASWRPMTRRALPFASAVVASADDPCCAVERAHALAHDWGSDCIVAGAAGSLDEAAGLGDWRAGRALLGVLLARAASGEAGTAAEPIPTTPGRAAAPTT